MCLKHFASKYIFQITHLKVIQSHAQNMHFEIVKWPSNFVKCCIHQPRSRCGWRTSVLILIAISVLKRQLNLGVRCAIFSVSPLSCTSFLVAVSRFFGKCDKRSHRVPAFSFVSSFRSLKNKAKNTEDVQHLIVFIYKNRNENSVANVVNWS